MSNYIVGDIHGCYDLLLENLYEIGFDKAKDHLYSVGDLIDRGKQNIECLKLIEEDWFSAVMGNHEKLMIDAIQSETNSFEFDNWYMNGGDWFNYIKEDIELVSELLNLVLTLPYYLTIDNKIGICHAQPPTHDWDDIRNNDISEDHKMHMIWGREWIRRGYTDGVKNIDAVYCGHTPIDSPISYSNVHFIDTGAVFTNNLTIIKL